MAQAARQIHEEGQQLALYEEWVRARSTGRRGESEKALCAACREREARYGFRDDHDDPRIERPRTLCFECFRVEIERRQAIVARLARGWNAEQVRLPLDETLRELTRRRCRAQIAARHAIGA